MGDSQKYTAGIIRRLLNLADKGTYSCDLGGARNITTLIDVANAEIRVLEGNITKEEEDE